jgi:ketosteroid isomerase-like protein
MKKLRMLFFAVLAIGCSKQNANTQEEKNSALVKSMFEAFNQHNWEKMASYYADSARFLDPSFGKEYVTQSREQIARKYNEMSKTLINLHDEVLGVYPSGSKVFVEFVSTATLPDGTAFSLPIGTVLTIENDLIVKDATYYDN